MTAPNADSATRRATYLGTSALFRLDLACHPLIRAFGPCIYLVGSANTSPDFRDVDVRAIIDDETFDRVFAHEPVWEVFGFAVSAWLEQLTGLPIDFQVQRQTEANFRFTGRRNPLGVGRPFAGLGDATPFRDRTVPA